MRGRKALPPTPGTRNSLGLKVTAETKHKLLEAARHSGRSMSQEAESRIERSFVDDEVIKRIGGLIADQVANMAEQQGRGLKELTDQLERMRTLP